MLKTLYVSLALSWMILAVACATGVEAPEDVPATGGSTVTGGSAATGGTGGTVTNGGSAGTSSNGGAGGVSPTGGTGGTGPTGGMGGTGPTGGTGGTGPTGGMGGTGASGGMGGGVTVDLSAAADSYIDAYIWGTNYGSATELLVRRWTSSYSRRTVIRFDVAGSMPANATITNAQLCLTAYAVSHAMTINVHRLQTPWTESGVTWMHSEVGQYWTTMGGDYDASESAAVAIAAGGIGEICWNVTSDAATFYTAPTSNYGWLLRDPQDSGGSSETTSFRSREYSADVPRLQITYLP